MINVIYKALERPVYGYLSSIGFGSSGLLAWITLKDVSEFVVLFTAILGSLGAYYTFRIQKLRWERLRHEQRNDSNAKAGV